MIESGEVKLHFLDYWRVVRMRAGLIVLVFLLVMVSAGVTVYFLPRRFLAKVTMEVKPDDAGSRRIDMGGSGRNYDPTFTATQFQILRKTEILYPVIKQLDLVNVFSGDGPKLSPQLVSQILDHSIDLQEVRNTNLIEVGVWHTDKVLAANIANTIAVEYRNRRLADLKKASTRALADFQDEVARLRKVTQEAQLEATQIRTKGGIVDADPESLSAVIDQGGTSYQSATHAVDEQRLKVANLRSLLESIQTLKPEALKEALRQFGIEDQGMINNLAQLQAARVDETNLLNSGLGENHPRIRGLRAKMAEYTKILNELLDGIRRAQASKVTLEEKALGSLEARQELEKNNAVTQKNEGSSYSDAKARYIQARDLLKTAEQRLQSAIIDFGAQTEPVNIWQRAEPPLYADSPPVKQYMVGAVFIGLIIGILLAFFIEYLDTSVKTIEDVERFLETTVLAVIPKGIPMLIKTHGDHVDAEAYRILRVNLDFNKPSADSKTLTLISAGPGEGKSTTLNNLAFTCAKGGYNVLVVDADLRRPTQHNFFETDNKFGLTDFLLGKATADAITRTTKIDNLSFVPSGVLPSDAVGILNSQAMVQFIAHMKSQYDFVLFDSPPILGVSDGSVLASEVDMTLMVVQHRRFPRSMLQRVNQAVKQAGGKLVGVVLNNVDTRHDDGSSYYNAYQQYYATARKEPEKEVAGRNSGGSSPATRRRRPRGRDAPNGTNGHHEGDY